MDRISETDFWPWAFSDFLSNALRGVLAEYIVACATGCTQKKRIEWDAYDLITETGIKIEVKSSAYLQSWEQKRPSTLKFDIAPKRSLDVETNGYSAVSSRPADVYVFCVFTSLKRATADPLCLDQWSFLVSSTEALTRRFGSQKTVGLATLEAFGLEQVSYQNLEAQIIRMAASPCSD